MAKETCKSGEKKVQKDAIACSVSGCSCTGYVQESGVVCKCGHGANKHTGKAK
jgi:hypothetical protein